MMVVSESARLPKGQRRARLRCRLPRLFALHVHVRTVASSLGPAPLRYLPVNTTQKLECEIHSAAIERRVNFFDVVTGLVIISMIFDSEVEERNLLRVEDCMIRRVGPIVVWPDTLGVVPKANGNRGVQRRTIGDGLE